MVGLEGREIIQSQSIWGGRLVLINKHNLKQKVNITENIQKEQQATFRGEKNKYKKVKRFTIYIACAKILFTANPIARKEINVCFPSPSSLNSELRLKCNYYSST